MTTRWHERYGPDSAPPPDTAAALDRIGHLLAHRSVRAFSDAPLPAGTLEALVAAAQSAATSSNLQTWSVVVVADPARRARLAAWANNQAHVVAAPLFLVWLADLSRLERAGERLGTTVTGPRYLETFLVAAIDAALAAQNAVVAAEALGLGTNYIGAIRNRPLEVAAELKLPPRVFPVFGLCVGYPDPARPADVKPRLPQRAVLHHEHYAAGGAGGAVTDAAGGAATDAAGGAAFDEAALIDGYDAVLDAFQQQQRMNRIAWSRQATQRIRGPESLSGRDKLADQIRAQGFGLE